MHWIISGVEITIMFLKFDMDLLYLILYNCDLFYSWTSLEILSTFFYISWHVWSNRLESGQLNQLSSISNHINITRCNDNVYQLFYLFWWISILISRYFLTWWCKWWRKSALCGITQVRGHFRPTLQFLSSALIVHTAGIDYDIHSTHLNAI